MKQHEKKMIAPIVIGALLIAWFLIYVVCCIIFPLPLFVKVLGVLIPLALAGVAFYVTWERIQEIRSGEEDDLSNY